MAEVVDARALVNALVALLASGGSTNHCIHLIAIARAAGYRMNWSDFDAISSVTPLIARVYPNGSADVNHFHAAGGTGALFATLLDAGLMHADAKTCFGNGFGDFCQEPTLVDGQIEWRSVAASSLDPEVLTTPATPFAPNGGVKLLEGNLGRSVIKTSAVQAQHHIVEAPAVVIDDQDDLKPLFEAGEPTRIALSLCAFRVPRQMACPNSTTHAHARRIAG